MMLESISPSYRTRLAFSIGAVLGLIGPPLPAEAEGCSGSQTIVCTGDVGEIVETVNAKKYSEGSMAVEDLTANAISVTFLGTAPSPSSTGNNGKDSPSLTLTFDGDLFGVADGYSGVATETVATDGYRGKNRDGLNDKNGGNGGDGGLGGGVATVIASGFLDSFAGGVVASSEGGDGGKGGTGESYAAKGTGGNGGDGGKGGRAEVRVGDVDSPLSITTGDADVAAALQAGLQAISLAGDGGKGGKGKADSFGKAKGGKGGEGGSGGTVAIDAHADLTHAGTTPGIYAASLGGAGGQGGDANSVFGSGSGGAAKGPGPGGNVTVTFDGTLTTTGTESAPGIFAQSVGGFAHGGGSASGRTAYGASTQSSGNGLAVQVTLDVGSSIATQGTVSGGIEAMSIGGGGGKGGSASGIGSLGGTGAAGGNGGAVQVRALGSEITTLGDGSSAILAASVGGGGGNGGNSGGVVALGSEGGAGGNGGYVLVQNLADLSTAGDEAMGIYAYSIGDGGGASGSASSAFSVGADGGDGGTGGNVNVINLGSVSTLGQDSPGVYLSSVGGGGGNGGKTVGANLLFSGSIGGNGGVGGSASDVLYNGVHADKDGNAVANDSVIETAGDFSSAIYAESIGGGGGRGGHAVGAVASYGVGVTIGHGGDGGLGQDGGSVTITSNSRIATAGEQSSGIYATSTGGGGGNAGWTVAAGSATQGVVFDIGAGADGSASGAGGDVSVSFFGRSLATTGDQSDAIYAESLGGGGGRSDVTVAAGVLTSVTINFAMGGSGGSGGDAGAVEVEVDSDVSTTGDVSSGIVAQSVAGGGGNAGAVVSGSAMSEISANFALGQDGGDGGTASTVTVNQAGRLSVAGAQSDGIMAQSLGGSGGKSGLVLTATAIDTADANVAVGGDGGEGGVAAAVEVETEGSIELGGDLSSGIFAQSVGGSGGSGRASLSLAAVSTQASLGFSLGGSGGDGGVAGTVQVTNAAAITHSGSEQTYGILAQSMGGSGGHGGTAISAEGITTKDVRVSLAGGGGDGGAADEVTVENQGAISLTGNRGAAILAQSVGGSGGAGGLAISGGITTVPKDSSGGSLFVSVGGGGGDGGRSQDVSVTTTSESSIETSGFESIGIIAQSLGGSGGVAGDAYTGSVLIGSGEKGTANVQVSVGGEGGDGGKTGAVSVVNLGSVTTSGDSSPGIFAQSVGGEGGMGGGAYSLYSEVNFKQGDTKFVSKQSFNATVNVGGSGGTGKDAKSVTVRNENRVSTAATQSHGIWAQSVGGGGGAGGIAASLILNPNIIIPTTDTEASSSTSGYKLGSVKFGLNLGGDGGSGGDGDQVTVSNSALIETEGEVAHAIYAQSIGGGGGDGGSGLTKSITLPGVCNISKIVGAYYCTKSDETGKPKDEATEIDVSLSVLVGGQGGAAGDGGDVAITTDGQSGSSRIATSGDGSYGIYAESVGGGGGHGGDAKFGYGPYADDETIAEINTVYGAITSADIFNKIDALKKPTALSVSIGGSGGAQGDGGDVTITNTGSVSTSGEEAIAIYAMSVGGGGGEFGVGGTAYDQGIMPVVNFALGGQGSGGGDGGDIAITSSGPISTSGTASAGIYAQSTGGGGGAAGDVMSYFKVGTAILNIGAGTGVQQDAGDGGDGGDISIVLDGSLTTTGADAHGIVAMSIGGSGGIAAISEDPITQGWLEPFTFVGSAGDEGAGGSVAIDINAPIAVSGEGSHAVIAGSISGEEDAFISITGDVSVEIDAAVSSSGRDGRGLLITNSSYGSAGKTSITIGKTGSLIVGDETQAAITLIGSKELISNEPVVALVNKGLIYAPDASYSSPANDDESVDVLALETSNQYVSVTNYNSFFGSVSVDPNEALISAGKGSTYFRNALLLDQDGNVEMTGRLGLGRRFELGKRSTLLNEGQMSPAGLGAIGQTALEVETLTQLERGIWQVDLSFGNDASVAQSADKIVVAPPSGRSLSIDLAGSVLPNAFDEDLAKEAQSGSFTILEASSDKKLSFDASELVAIDSAVVDYELETTESEGTAEIELTYAISYNPWEGFSGASYDQAAAAAAASDNVRAFGDYFEQLVLYTDPDSASVLPGAALDQEEWLTETADYLVEVAQVSSLIDIYEGMIPEVQTAPLDATLFASLGFADKLQSCAAIGEEQVITFSTEGSCLWIETGGSYIDRQAGSHSTGYQEADFGLALGGQMEAAHGIFVGLGFSYEKTWLTASSLAETATGNRFQGGAVVKYLTGPYSLSGSVSGGVNTIDLARVVQTPTAGTLIADSSPQLNFVSFHTRGARRFDLGGWSLTPTFDGGLEVQWQGSFEESGAGDYGMRFDGYSHLFGTLNPFLEAARAFTLTGLFGETVQGQVYGRAGVLGIVGGDDRSLSAGFLGVPAANGLAFTIEDQVSPISADIGLGVELAGFRRWSLSAETRALLAGDQQSVGGGLRASFLF